MSYSTVIAPDDDEDVYEETYMMSPSVQAPPVVPAASAVLLPAFQLLPKKSAAPMIHSTAVHEAALEAAAVGPSFPQQYSSSFSVNEGKRNHRKQEREIEQSLMQGDLSKIGGASLVDVQGNQPWDTTHYEDRKKREMEIYAKYNIAGTKAGDKALNVPTKGQNKRHHINSLALRAAEAELALLDASGGRSKTKAETQAKYGW